MLRASADQSSLQLDLSGVSDFMTDSGVPAGGQLIALTDAVVLRDSDELELARTAAAEQLGVAATVRAIAIASNFMMMNIIMDALGTKPPGDSSDLPF
jgi:hypothetical protein